MKAKGFADPYDMEAMPIKKDATKEQPNVVYTLQKDRIIGCLCNEEQHHVNYTHIFKGETKRCSCGIWFTCKERELPDLSEYGIKNEVEHH